MVNRIKIQHKGLFKGNFVVTTQENSFSIGDYIELFLSESPYPTGEFVEGYPIINLKMRIVESCLRDEIDVILQTVSGCALKHWLECLEIGKISVVLLHKYQWGNHIWYMPKIDGYVPGMFKKTKAPTIGSKRRSNEAC